MFSAALLLAGETGWKEVRGEDRGGVNRPRRRTRCCFYPPVGTGNWGCRGAAVGMWERGAIRHIRMPHVSHRNGRSSSSVVRSRKRPRRDRRIWVL